MIIKCNMIYTYCFPILDWNTFFRGQPSLLWSGALFLPEILLVPFLRFPKCLSTLKPLSCTLSFLCWIWSWLYLQVQETIQSCSVLSMLMTTSSIPTNPGKVCSLRMCFYFGNFLIIIFLFNNVSKRFLGYFLFYL